MSMSDATRIARRSDALFTDGRLSRRELCNKIARLEYDIEAKEMFWKEIASQVADSVSEAMRDLQ